MFWFFGPEACGISAPQPGTELVPLALEGEVLTTGPPGKSQSSDIFLSPCLFLLWCSMSLGVCVCVSVSLYVCVCVLSCSLNSHIPNREGVSPASSEGVA